MADAGTRHPVLLIHGWPVTAFHWRHLIPALERAEFEPIAITLPGLGAPPDAPGIDYRKSRLASRVASTIAARGIRRCSLIGHDWGASVVTLLAASAPEAVSALVIEEDLVGSGPGVPEPGRDHYPTWHGPFNRAPSLAEAMVPGREAAYYGAFLRESAGPAGLDEEIIREYVEAYRAPGVLEAGLKYYRTIDQDDDDIARLVRAPLTVPVLAIGGRFAMGTSVAANMRTVARDVSELIAESSGHYPAEQEPEVVAAAVVEFLARRR